MGIEDCVIVGGGPAGLTAGLYLARYLREVTGIDAQGGRARLIPRTHNVAPFPEGISGADLLDRMRSHAVLYGGKLKNATVNAVERQGDQFHIATDYGFEIARTIIFATGVFNHRPPLSKDDHDLGVSRGLIRYCPVCDAYEVRDRRIAVLGDTVHGFKEASFLRHYSPTVTLIPPVGARAVERGGVGVLDAPLKKLELSQSEVIVTLETGETVCFDTLYVALGTSARSKLAADVGVRLNEAGHIEVDAMQRTSVEGAYAIGDVTEGLDQIAVAMGQAAVAATAIHNDLR